MLHHEKALAYCRIMWDDANRRGRRDLAAFWADWETYILLNAI